MKKDYTNLNVLKIICMFLIVSGHYVAHNNLLNKVNFGTINYFILQIFRFLVPVALNTFVVITGFFMINKNIKSKKIINLIFQTMFYSLTIYIVLSLIMNNFSVKGLVINMMPINSGQYWFITVYLSLYIIVPFINKVLIKLNKRGFIYLLEVLTFLLVINKSIFTKNTFIIPSYFSLTWFVYLYILGAYIKLYGMPNNNIIISIAIFIICLLINIFGSYYFKKIFNKELQHLYDYNFITNVVLTILLFNIFNSMNCGKEKIKKTVNKMVPLILAVYLISDNRVFRMYMWENIFKVNEFVNSKYMLVHLFCTVSIIFSVSMFIEFFRTKIWNIIIKNKRIEKMFNKVDSIINLENMIVEDTLYIDNERGKIDIR